MAAPSRGSNRREAIALLSVQPGTNSGNDEGPFPRPADLFVEPSRCDHKRRRSSGFCALSDELNSCSFSEPRTPSLGTFIATTRPKPVSIARKTVPKPPWPMTSTRRNFPSIRTNGSLAAGDDSRAEIVTPEKLGSENGSPGDVRVAAITERSALLNVSTAAALAERSGRASFPSESLAASTGSCCRGLAPAPRAKGPPRALTAARMVCSCD